MCGPPSARESQRRPTRFENLMVAHMHLLSSALKRNAWLWAAAILLAFPLVLGAEPAAGIVPANASVAPALAQSLTADDPLLPPARPTRVEVDIELVEVSSIQDHDQQFDVEFVAYFVWRDPRLAFDPTTVGTHKKVIPSDRLWTPDPLLLNELEVDSHGGATAHVQPDGTICLHRYYRGKISGSFDLHEFPLDRHALTIGLQAINYEIDEVVYSMGEVRTANPSHVVPHGWKLVQISQHEGTSRFARTNETFSQVQVQVQVARDPHFYLFSIVLPLIPIMATAWSVFWMDPKEFSSQVGVGITAMLTVVAYRITIDSSLPPLTYMTRMDYFLLVCQTFVFLAFVSTVTIHVLYALDTPHMNSHAARLTEYCRWLPPVVLLLISLLLGTLPVRFGTYVLLAPVACLAVWLRRPLLHLPRTLRAIIKPELLLDVKPAVAASVSPPHSAFNAKRAADLREPRRRDH